jgi:hypothetical protein
MYKYSYWWRILGMAMGLMVGLALSAREGVVEFGPTAEWEGDWQSGVVIDRPDDEDGVTNFGWCMELDDEAGWVVLEDSRGGRLCFIDSS